LGRRRRHEKTLAMTTLIFLLWGTVYGQKYTPEEVEAMFQEYRHEIGLGVAIPLPPYLTLGYRAHFGRHAVAVSVLANPSESLYAGTWAYQYSFAVGRFAIYWGAGLYAAYTPKRTYNALSRERYFLNLTVKEQLPAKQDTVFARYIYYTAEPNRSWTVGAGAFLTIGAKWHIPKRYLLGAEVSPLAYGITYMNVINGERRELSKSYRVGDGYVEELQTESEIPSGNRVRRVVGDFPLRLIYPKIYFSVLF
jgi:hypothetical protein